MRIKDWPLVLGFVALGCASREPERPLRTPPPPPLPEIRSGAETPGLVWAPGYWHWDGVHDVWIPGHWESPPRYGRTLPAPTRTNH